MSGPFEKYVEPAAAAVDPDVFDEADPHRGSLAYEFRREIACNRARRTLAAVGPLIAEDARERMVAAAARAVERECAEDPREAIAGEIIERITARRSEITPGRPGWVYFTEAIDMVNEVCGIGEAS